MPGLIDHGSMKLGSVDEEATNSYETSSNDGFSGIKTKLKSKNEVEARQKIRNKE